jgi:multiple sugar transport system permease protein
MMTSFHQGTGEVVLSDSSRKSTFWEVITSEKYFRWTLLVPLILVLLLFLIYPFFYCLYYSFTDYHITAPAQFIGLDNYFSILRDTMVFWPALGKTALVLVISVVVELILGLSIAMLLNRDFKGQNIVRGLCLLPLMIMPLAMSMVWNFILQYDFGAVNQILVALGGHKVSWFNPRYAIYILAFINIWQWFPFSVFVLLAGLKSLPRDAFEAAKVDGASAWTIFRKLTLPMLSPLITIIILLRTMWLIRFFDPLYGTTRGGANTEVLDWMMYRTTFVFFDIGNGSALALISLFMTIILCAILFRELMRALGVIK